MAGTVALSIWAGSRIIPAVWQDWDNWAFDRELRGEPASLLPYLAERQRQIVREVAPWWRPEFTPTAPVFRRDVIPPAARRPPRLKNGALIGRLTIPRLHLSAMVREGSGENTLSLALGHISGTVLPGQKGNVGVAGHRDTIFRSLQGIRKNDLIQFETLSGRYTYQVGNTEIVKPADVGVLRSGEEPELTLVTCYPFYYVGSAPERWIVKARQVSSGAPSEAAVSEAASDSGSAKEELTKEHTTAEQTTAQATFNIPTNHSRQLAPGISLGITETDVPGRQVNGWMWLMPERRTIWLRNQDAREPFIFYCAGKRRELRITNVTDSFVTVSLL